MTWTYVVPHSILPYKSSWDGLTKYLTGSQYGKLLKPQRYVRIRLASNIGSSSLRGCRVEQTVRCDYSPAILASVKGSNNAYSRRRHIDRCKSYAFISYLLMRKIRFSPRTPLGYEYGLFKNFLVAQASVRRRTGLRIVGRAPLVVYIA